MSRNWMRFGVGDGQWAWGATWKLWADQGGETAEVNLASRFLDGRLVASRDPAGAWRVAFVRPAADAQGASDENPRPYGDVVACHHPRQLAEGCLLAFRLLTPTESVTLPHLAGRFRYVAWIPKAQPRKAVETTVFITETHRGAPQWQARDFYGRALLGSFAMGSGQRVSVYYRTVDAACGGDSPDGLFFVGAADALGCGRQLAVGREPHGALVVHDIAVAGRGAHAVA